MATSGEKNLMINTVKLYIFPSLLSILAILIWRDVSELRSDVKSLLAQSNVDKTKIEILEKEVQALEQVVLYKKQPSAMLFKHEEEFDVKKYIPKEL